MKNKVLLSIFSLILCISVGISASAAGFVYTRQYANQFSDVAADAWYYNDVKEAYQYGFVDGVASDSFAPDNNVTLAETIKLTCVIHAQYSGKKIKEDKRAPWYQVYLDYAKENNILPFAISDYDKPATRSEFARIMASSVPESYLAPIREIADGAIHDVQPGIDCYDAVYLLYRAGVLTGSDKYGSFLPETSITRAEVATIINRIVAPKNRKTGYFLERPYEYPALYDTTVYTTDERLVINGIPLPGVVKIGGEAFFPAENLKKSVFVNGLDIIRDDDTVDVILRSYALRGEVRVPNSKIVPVPDRVVGTATRSNELLSFSMPPAKNESYRPGVDSFGSIYYLDGKMPLIMLRAIGASPADENGDHHLNAGDGFYEHTIVFEDDLVAEALPGLLRDTHYDTALSIHDYIVNTLTYDPEYEAPYGYTEEMFNKVREQKERSAQWFESMNTNFGLHTRYGICDTYAKIYLDMCTRAGIPCRYVEGESRGMAHAWNEIYLDGAWQYVDCTWDDPISMTPKLEHTYFLISPDYLANSHWWDEFPMPKVYDPAWENIDPNNVKSRDEFRKCLAAQLKMGVNPVRIKGSYGGFSCINHFSAYYDFFWWEWSSSYRDGYYEIYVN